MKYIKIFIIAVFISLLLQNCSPLKTLTIETISPSSVNLPRNFNKIAFLNFETDLNNDGKIDSILYKIITNEMSLGFRDATYNVAGVDTSDFLFVEGYPELEKFYFKDTINWQYLEKIPKSHSSNIFIVLDSLNISMETDQFPIGYYDPQYYIYREIAIKAYWKVFDILEKKKLDQYIYTDTLIWDATGYHESTLKDKLPSLERSIRETSYFAAMDYANRIFPSWQTETRQYFIFGNKDFEKAAKLAEQSRWLEAAELWDQYLNDIDREIASRANFNMAVASEILGEIDLAIKYAVKSYQIKSKSRTKYYINILKKRQQEIKQLQKQL
ncbi:MAG: DUF6340 family protein [Thiohalospira sp.]